MNRIFLLLFIISSNLYSQINLKLISENKELNNISLNIKKDSLISKYSTNGEGVAVLQYSSKDSIYLTINKKGYNLIKDSLLIGKNNILINLTKNDSLIRLNEVYIAKKEKLNKSYYKINPSDFIENTRINTAINTIPNIIYSPEIGLKYNNRDVILTINDIISDTEELKTIDIKTIDKFEIIENPSNSFGTDFNGVVINIILKKEQNNFLKGDLELSRGIRLHRSNIFPSISFKSNNLIVKLFSSVSYNNQEIIKKTDRYDDNINSIQNQSRLVKGYQDYSNVSLNYKLNRNSYINMSAITNGFKFKGNTTGENIINDYDIYSSKDKEKLRNWVISSVYSLKLKNSYEFLAKFRFQNHVLNNYVDFNDKNYITNFFSKTRDFSTEINLNGDIKKILNLNGNFSIGVKPIWREFEFSNNLNYKQNIINIYLDNYLEIFKNTSISYSLSYDYTKNSLGNITQIPNYKYFIPNLSLIHKWDNNKLSFNFSKKITRPSSDKLNPDILYINSLNIYKGNPELNPEKRFLYEFTFQKTLKDNTSINSRLFFEKSNNAIIEDYIYQDTILIYSHSNNGNYNKFGLSSGISSKISKIRFNLNTGLVYSIFNETPLFNKINGLSFTSNLYINTVIKKEYSFFISTSYNSPIYFSMYKKEIPIVINSGIEKNFLKNKLNLNISYYDMFGLRKKTDEFYQTKKIHQFISTSNNITNLLITLRYNFGKTFNDSFKNPSINNNDLILKQ